MNIAPQSADLMPLAEVATTCRVSDRTVRRWLMEGRLRILPTPNGVRVDAAPLPPPDSHLLTRAEAARFLGVPPQALSRWASAGHVPSIRTLGGHHRFAEADLKARIHNQKET